MDKPRAIEKLPEENIRKAKRGNKALNAISLEAEVLAKASEGYGSLDEETLIIRYAAMRIARMYVGHPDYVVT